MAIQDTLEQLQDFDINDVDWERIGVWPFSARVGVCVVTAIAILVATYFLVIKDLNVAYEMSVNKETTLRQSFQSKSFQAANLDAYREQMKEMDKSFDALVSQLPSDTEVPGLLEDIDEKGSDSGLVINSIELQDEAVAEFYVELPINIEVQGGYHDMGSFVSGIAGMPRIVTLHDYEISDKDGQLLMTIAAKTYRYKSQDE